MKTDENIAKDQYRPIFRQDYDIGWVGFTFEKRSFVSTGIGWFTRRKQTGKRKVSHVFIVVDKDTGIEAGPKGVVRFDMSKYYDTDKFVLIFRRPRGWDLGMGIELAKSAEDFLGQKYGYALLLAHGFSNSVIGGALDALTAGYLGKGLRRLTDAKNQQICMELVANIFRRHYKLKYLGCMRKDPADIDPQELFEDDGVFDVLSGQNEWQFSDVV